MSHAVSPYRATLVAAALAAGLLGLAAAPARADDHGWHGHDRRDEYRRQDRSGDDRWRGDRWRGDRWRGDRWREPRYVYRDYPRYGWVPPGHRWPPPWVGYRPYDDGGWRDCDLPRYPRVYYPPPRRDWDGDVSVVIRVPF